MACCAFVAFLIGQCLAMADGLRRRLRRLVGLRVDDGGAAHVSAAPPRTRWRLALGLALAIELGFAGGWLLVAAGGGQPGLIAAWCSAGKSADR